MTCDFLTFFSPGIVFAVSFSMGRPLRMFAKEQAYFITQRCFQARMLMAPTAEVVNTIGGILAKATQRYDGIRLHDFFFASNHFHLILTATAPAQIPRFVGWLSREISVRVGALVSWRGAFFERRYDAAPILDDEALFERVMYLRAHGVKEGLVESSEAWPGLSALPELHHGVQRVFGFESKTQGLVERLPIRLFALPAWEGLSKDDHTARQRELTRTAVADARRARGDIPYLGADCVRRQDPRHAPTRAKRSPRVRCFVTTAEDRRAYWQSYKAFVEGLRESYGNLLVAWRRIGHETFYLPGFGLTYAPP